MEQIINKERYYEYKEDYITQVYHISNDIRVKLSYKKMENNNKALLWIHGFNDYYYHYHVGEKLLNNGYDIYAITLRRYGETNDDSRY